MCYKYTRQSRVSRRMVSTSLPNDPRARGGKWEIVKHRKGKYWKEKISYNPGVLSTFRSRFFKYFFACLIAREKGEKRRTENFPRWTPFLDQKGQGVIVKPGKAVVWGVVITRRCIRGSIVGIHLSWWFTCNSRDKYAGYIRSSLRFTFP